MPWRCVHHLAPSGGRKRTKSEKEEKAMWENELIMFRLGFYLLILICLLLGAILLKLWIDHRELTDVLKHLATHSHCEEEKKGDG